MAVDVARRQPGPISAVEVVAMTPHHDSGVEVAVPVTSELRDRELPADVDRADRFGCLAGCQLGGLHV